MLAKFRRENNVKKAKVKAVDKLLTEEDKRGMSDILFLF